MCLAVPMKIESIDAGIATTCYGGGEYKARVDLVDARIGDYILVHAGIAVAKLDEDEALETLRLLREMDALNRSIPRPGDGGGAGEGD